MRRLVLFFATATFTLACQQSGTDLSRHEEPQAQPAAPESPRAQEPPTERPPGAKPVELARVAGPRAVENPKAAKKKVIPEDAPVIVSDNPKYDYGTVRPGDEVKHTFTVRNAGKSPLTIDRAKGG